jgi:hypothetical protein
LRHAIHDLRGSLNTSSVLLDLVVVLTSRDPALASAKAHLAVRELQRTARMLDHLVGTSDSLASELVPVDLTAAVAAASNSSPAALHGVVVDVGRLRPGCWIHSCPKRLSRALALVVEKCVEALPDGGSIDVAMSDAEPANGGQAANHALRLSFLVCGKRVLGPPQGRPRLHASKDAVTGKSTEDWFPILALVRGIGGVLHIHRQGGTELRLLFDFPRGSLHQP